MGLVIWAVLALSGCKKGEGTDWDTNLVAPIFRSTLTIQQLLPDSLTQINPDNTVSLVYDKHFTSAGFTNTKQLPDTTIVKYFTIPFGSVSLVAGDNFMNTTEETKLHLSPLELNRIIVKTGTIEVQVFNKINQPVDITYILPKAIKNGQVATFNATIPAYNSSNGGHFTTEFNLDDYSIDLRGITGNYVNRLVTHLIANVSTTATGTAQITSNDSLVVMLKLKKLIPYYAHGYFGQQQDTLNASSNVTVFDRVTAGAFSLHDARLNLSLSNGIGADIRASLLNFKSENSNTQNVVTLQHHTVGAMLNVHRATDNPFTPNVYNFEYNDGNSNLTELLANMPNRFSYSYFTELNPFGNLSGGNDFVYPEWAIDAHINIDIPLYFSATGLTLVDTIYLKDDTLKNHNSIKSGTLKLIASNYFPFDTDVEFYLLDENLQKQEQLMNKTTIQSAIPDADGKVRKPVESVLPAHISNELLNKLVQKRKVLTVVRINTLSNPLKYKIYSDYKLNLKLTGNMMFNIQVK